ERIADPLRGDRILVVTGVTDERPSRTERPPEEVLDGAACKARLARRAAETRGELGCKLERLAVVALDVRLVRDGLRVRPPDHDERQIVVRRKRAPAAVGAD